MAEEKINYTVTVERRLLDEFKALAGLRGVSAAAAIRAYMIRTVLNNEESHAKEVE